MNQKSKWWVDVFLFGSFIVTFFFDLTGLILHQWIGFAVCILAAYHLLSHWKWVRAVSKHFFDKLTNRSRLYYLIDVVMAVGFSIVLVTGMVISTWLNLSLTNFTEWLTLHIVASIITLLVTLLKIGVHWRWIVITPRLQTSHPAIPQVEIRGDVYSVNRREFLKVMGVTTVVGLIALNKSIQSLQENAASTITQSVKVNSTTSAELLELSQSANLTAQICTKRCRRGCSYPGHCRRYTDSNNNGYCDLGECL